VAANVAAGLTYGPIGAVVAAWPAVALVLSYELLMLVIRRAVPDAPASEARRSVAASKLPGRIAEGYEALGLGWRQHGLAAAGGVEAELGAAASLDCLSMMSASCMRDICSRVSGGSAAPAWRPNGLALSDHVRAEQVELDLPDDVGDAGFTGLAGGEVAGFLGLAGAGPVRAVAGEGGRS